MSSSFSSDAPGCRPPGDEAGTTGAEPGGATAKAELRRRFLAWRRGLSAAEVERRSSFVVGHLLAWPPFQRARVVMVYLAWRNEVDLSALVAAALAEGKAVSAPQVRATDMVLVPRRLTGAPGEVRPGWKGVPEPDPNLTEEVSPHVVDIILAPGVAFDRAGFRLGYGVGCYDRLLTLPGLRAVTVGVAYREQVLDRLPRDPWDRPVAAVATEDGVLCARA